MDIYGIVVDSTEAASFLPAQFRRLNRPSSRGPSRPRGARRRGSSWKETGGHQGCRGWEPQNSLLQTGTEKALNSHVDIVTEPYRH